MSTQSPEYHKPFTLVVKPQPIRVALPVTSYSGYLDPGYYSAQLVGFNVNSNIQVSLVFSVLPDYIPICPTCAATSPSSSTSFTVPVISPMDLTLSAIAGTHTPLGLSPNIESWMAEWRCPRCNTAADPSQSPAQRDYIAQEVVKAIESRDDQLARLKELEEEDRLERDGTA